ncbi:MAG TPA: hypothetical protein VNJ29_02095 [Candidatus Nitrosotenuis sp.]|nr:hypothetical protein [Candidatus Nitrosotenuis sp.]
MLTTKYDLYVNHIMLSQPIKVNIWREINHNDLHINHITILAPVDDHFLWMIGVIDLYINHNMPLEILIFCRIQALIL